MVVRDRRLEFIVRSKQRKSSKQIKSSSVAQTTNSCEKVVLDFLKKVEEINTKFIAIDRAISDVIRIQSAILQFSETDEKLYSSYNDIKSEIVVVADKLKKIEKSYNPKDFPGSPTELRICTTQVMTLKNKLSACVSYYFSIQEEYKEKCKAQVRRKAQIAGADISKVNFDKLMTKKTEVFIKKAIPDYDVSHYYVSEVKKRHEELLELEKNIENLRDLFFDMALVVQVDFALIDRVDKHSLAINKLVSQAKNNALHYRSAMRLKKYKKYLAFGCIAIFVVVGFLAFLVFFV